MRNITITLALFLSILSTSAQGLLSKQFKKPVASCGSHDYMKNIDSHNPGFMEKSDEKMQALSYQIKNSNIRRTNTEEIEIRVVFHVVYNNEEENLHDSVILNQLAVLNACFGRKNADTINLRPVFKTLAGNPNIKFKLADVDPNGKPTNGIVRTKTGIEYFGGTLPYGQNEQAEIVSWVNDSIYKNYGRLSKSSAGGSDAWNTAQYLNVWIGDLRIFEPKFNDFEEVFFLALATPPINLENWPESLGMDKIYEELNDGIYMHYNATGPNNPSKFPSPYDVYNGKATEGKILVHEAGHYLGLRHTWGDGDCSMDDFIDDTPKCTNSNQFSCSKSNNSCVDDFGGLDLPNMIENFMDYTSSACQNTFTRQQSELMRRVILERRSPLVSTNEIYAPKIIVYPNPSNGILNIEGISKKKEIVLVMEDYQGKQVFTSQSEGVSSYQIDMSFLNKGVYFIRIIEGENITVKRIVKI